MRVRRIIVPSRATRSGSTLRAFAEDLVGRIYCGLIRIPGANADELRRFNYEPGDLLVAPRVIRRDVTTLVPFDESGLLARGTPPRALIPVSNDGSGTFAARHAMPLLAALGFEAVVWHTTWRDANGDIPDAERLDPGAQRSMADIARIAKDARVAHRTIHTAVDSVPYGIVLTAYQADCAMIVMARGEAAIRGSYVESVLSASALPVLVVSREERSAS